MGPLISRLPSAIQGKVLKLAGQVLESGNNLFVSAKSKQEKDRNLKRSAGCWGGTVNMAGWGGMGVGLFFSGRSGSYLHTL